MIPIFLATIGFESLVQAFLLFFVVALLVFLALYIYLSLALMKIAKRTHTEHAWFAWIPYLNIYLVSQIADEAGWPVLLLFLPIIAGFFGNEVLTSAITLISGLVFVVFYFIWWWKIVKKRGKPGWWVLLMLIPVIGWIWALIMMGILAWGKSKKSSLTH